MDIDNSPTQYITVSPLSKGSPKKPIIIKSGVEKKLTGREREYDPNKHCGVWDADAKRNCTRSLTCKSHSVYLKRKVTNRAAPFDELLAAHKAEKEAAAKLNESSSESEPTSILARRLQLAPGTPQKPWELSEPLKQSSLLKCSVAKRNYFPQTQQFKDNYCDENLHYTTGKNTSNLIKSKQY
jgi:ataxin-7